MTSFEEDKGPPVKQELVDPQQSAAELDDNNGATSINDSFTAEPKGPDPHSPPPPDLPAKPIPSGDGPDVETAPPAPQETQPADAVALVPSESLQDANILEADPAAAVFEQQPLLPPNISLMMALAHISANQALPPPTVAPAQMSLPTPFNDSGDGSGPGLGHPLANNSAMGHGPGLESFARIEFADSVFQMTTYAVIIGRDQRALEQARRDEKRAQEYQRRVDENAAKGLPPPSPPAYDRGKFSKSYVSEEGGMLGPESDGDDNERPAKRRRTSTGRSASFTPQVADIPQTQQALQDKNPNLISNRQYVSHTPGAAAVDLASLRPSPYHVPFIGIHSPGPNTASRTKAISREHLKIQFNQERGVFEAVPLHKNGFFCDDVHYRDTKVVLKCGDRLQIKDVDFVFVINGVQPGRTGAEEYFDEEETSSKRYSEGGKEMSFEFENSHGGEIRETSEEEEDEEESGPDVEMTQSQDGSDDGDEQLEDEVMETIEGDAEAADVKAEPEQEQDLLLALQPPKKRGPGRPPKNGIRSKREERLLKKQAQELAKKAQPQAPPAGEPPVKRKVGRPRKHPLPENAGEKTEKRKYKPRKPKNAEGGEGSDGEKTAKEKRREKPKTPPLELKMEDFTEEQLQKPNKNYGVLIDEVLTEAPPQGLTLKQIYKRIQKRYPYYYFVVDTKGWESSVRHNLIGNDAFKKNEETHLWCRVPGIELDAGKKRKAASPDHAASLHSTGQTYGQHTQRAPMYRQGDPGAVGNQPARMSSALPPNFMPTNGLPYPPRTQHPLFKTARAGVGAAGHQQQQPGGQPQVGSAAGHLPANTTIGGAARAYQQGGAALPYSSPFTSTRPPIPSQSIPVGGMTSAVNGAGVSQQQQAGLMAQGSCLTGPIRGSGQQGTASATGGPRQGHAATANEAATGALLKPAIEPEAATYIANFKAQVVEQLQKRTPKAEIIALSAINRGMGLATRSPVPELDSMESIVLGIFQQSTQARFPAPSKSAATTAGGQENNTTPGSPSTQVQILHPTLLQTLLRFKASMVETLKPKLGEAKADALLLSAIDRVLGFSDRCTAQPADDAEAKEFEGAEQVLMPHIREKVAGCQRLLSGP